MLRLEWKLLDSRTTTRKQWNGSSSTLEILRRLCNALSTRFRRTITVVSLIIQQSWSKITTTLLSMDLEHEISNHSIMSIIVKKFPCSIEERWHDHTFLINDQIWSGDLEYLKPTILGALPLGRRVTRQAIQLLCSFALLRAVLRLSDFGKLFASLKTLGELSKTQEKESFPT